MLVLWVRGGISYGSTCNFYSKLGIHLRCIQVTIYTGIVKDLCWGTSEISASENTGAPALSLCFNSALFLARAIYCVLLGHPEGYKHFTASNSVVNLLYTRVNKCIHLCKNALNTHYVLNNEGKNWPHAQNRDASVVACVHDNKWVVYLAVKRTQKLDKCHDLRLALKRYVNGSYRTSHGWYFCSFVHSDVMKNLSRALSTNLPPSHSTKLLKTLGWKRDGGGGEPREISTRVHCQLKTFRSELGRATPAAHETSIKLEAILCLSCDHLRWYDIPLSGPWTIHSRIVACNILCMCLLVRPSSFCLHNAIATSLLYQELICSLSQLSKLHQRDNYGGRELKKKSNILH